MQFHVVKRQFPTLKSAPCNRTYCFRLMRDWKLENLPNGKEISVVPFRMEREEYLWRYSIIFERNFRKITLPFHFKPKSPDFLANPWSPKHLGDHVGRFPFDQKFRFEISGIPYDEWNGIFRFVEPTRPRPSRSKFRAKRQTVKQGKMC